MFGLWLAAWGVAHSPHTEGPDSFAWIVVLLIQSVPYASSLLASLTSAFPLPAKLLGIGYRPVPSASAAGVPLTAATPARKVDSTT